MFSLKETLHDPRGSNESRKSELVTERERVKEEVQRKEEELDGKVEHTNNLYFEILQQVSGDRPDGQQVPFLHVLLFVPGCEFCDLMQHVLSVS